MFVHTYCYQWRLVHSDGTEGLVAGQDTMISAGTSDIDVDPRGLSLLHRGHHPFVHCFTQTEKLVACLVTVFATYALQCSLCYSIQHQKAVADYSKAKIGAQVIIQPDIDLGICNVHIPRAVWRTRTGVTKFAVMKI